MSRVEVSKAVLDGLSKAASHHGFNHIAHTEDLADNARFIVETDTDTSIPCHAFVVDENGTKKFVGRIDVSVDSLVCVMSKTAA